MIVKFFNRGIGKGSSPTAYLMQPVDANGQQREVLPVCMSGNPTLCARLIDSIDRKYKYTSGVLAFHRDDKPTLEQQIEIITGFEELAFAGLERDQWHCTWIKHEHCGNVELHFLTPKIEMRSGRQLNIAPPGAIGTFGCFKDNINARYGFADPDDPERAQAFRLSHNQSDTQKQIKTKIYAYIDQCKLRTLENSEDYNRECVLSDLNALDGISVSRETESAVSITLDGHTRAIRLTGEVYGRSFRATRTIDRKEAASERMRTEDDQTKRVNKLQSELESRIKRRSKFNQERFGAVGTKHQETNQNPTGLVKPSKNNDGHNNKEPDGSGNPSGNPSGTDTLKTTTNTREIGADTLHDQKKSSLVESNCNLGFSSFSGGDSHNILGNEISIGVDLNERTGENRAGNTELKRDLNELGEAEKIKGRLLKQVDDFTPTIGARVEEYQRKYQPLRAAIVGLGEFVRASKIKARDLYNGFKNIAGRHGRYVRNGNGIEPDNFSGYESNQSMRIEFEKVRELKPESERLEAMQRWDKRATKLDNDRYDEYLEELRNSYSSRSPSRGMGM